MHPSPCYTHRPAARVAVIQAWVFSSIEITRERRQSRVSGAVQTRERRQSRATGEGRGPPPPLRPPPPPMGGGGPAGPPPPPPPPPLGRAGGGGALAPRGLAAPPAPG